MSTTDPDSTYATKGGTPARLGYYDNYLVDNDSCVTAARMSQDTVAAQDMIARFAQCQWLWPERFTYLPESNSYRCPAGEQLNYLHYLGLNVRNRAHAYIGSANFPEAVWGLSAPKG